MGVNIALGWSGEEWSRVGRGGVKWGGVGRIG